MNENCRKCDGTGINPESPDEECSHCSGLKELDWISNITGVELTRGHKSILFVVKTLNELVEKGILTDGGMKLTPSALELIEDFKPTDEEIRTAMAQLKSLGFVR